MVNFPKIIQAVDAVVDCFPVASTVTNGLYLFYQTAHKVDTHNPVKPGFKTSLKIHVLSKPRWNCALSAIPGIGNLFNLIALVYNALDGFKKRDRIPETVLRSQNQELIHLCKGNGEIEETVPELLSQLKPSEKYWNIETLGNDHYNEEIITRLPKDIPFPLVAPDLLKTESPSLLKKMSPPSEEEGISFLKLFMTRRGKNFAIIEYFVKNHEAQIPKELKLDLLKYLPIGLIDNEAAYAPQIAFYATYFEKWRDKFSEEEIASLQEPLNRHIFSMPILCGGPVYDSINARRSIERCVARNMMQALVKTWWPSASEKAKTRLELEGFSSDGVLKSEKE